MSGVDPSIDDIDINSLSASAVVFVGVVQKQWVASCGKGYVLANTLQTPGLTFSAEKLK
jgi:hypothetical protein